MNPKSPTNASSDNGKFILSTLLAVISFNVQVSMLKFNNLLMFKSAR